MSAHRMERRAVRSQDPTLSDRANAALTEELRRVIGAESVEVPAERPREARRGHGGRPGPWVELVDNRLALGMLALAALVVGAVITLITGSWWFLVGAVALDLIGLVLVATMVIRMTGEQEHLSPEANALLEEEGVDDPDGVFTRLIAEFSPPDGHDREERETPAHADEAQATTEQDTAMTPTEERSRAVGP
ncbi:hypothetical protein [Conexibacter arvalis]|uniref:Uncharacterized protein n=1 Tax=Conexibacter arvalis TaxID=912552 RepID=A0A840IM05_9ACTN|nr:hypothetical protein [Conexibacter arvalis]MBB4665183.1 hypothetical protein [Conexibacter arvalis]